MVETVNHADPGYGFWVVLGLFILWGVAWENLQTARYYLDGRLAGAHTMSNLLLNARLIEDAGQQRNYIALLTDLVRYNYDKQAQEVVSLQEELTQAASLVAMHNLSHGTRVRWEPDSGLETLKMDLPPFSLLCLVENALTHGLDPLQETAAVRIASGPGNKRIQALYLSGFDLPQARILRRPPKGHGLHYLQQRLYRLFVAKANHHNFVKPYVQGDQLIVQFPI